jgi:hypothetical protein
VPPRFHAISWWEEEGEGARMHQKQKVGAIGWGDRRILCTHLQAVADPENGNTKLEDVTVDVGGIMVIN